MKSQMGERVEILSRARDRLKLHLGSMAPKATVQPKRGRLRTASVASVAAKPGGRASVDGPGVDFDFDC